MIKAVIFDLDGTLADTMEDLKTAMNMMLSKRGWNPRTREELLSFINRGARAFVASSMPEGSWSSIDDPEITESLKIYNECYAVCYADKTSAYPGLTDVLKHLKEKGIRLAVLSNKQDKFVKAIVEKLFPGIFLEAWGQSTFPTKPDPSAALEIAKILKADPSDCVFVGDSDVDMKTALAAGMYPLGVSWGYRDEETLYSAGAADIAHNASELLEKLTV